MKYFASVIIPALNEERHIRGCLQALLSLHLHDMQYEIIVVDNGSSDRTVEIAKSFGVKVIIAEKVHVATLRNLGARMAQGNILAFVDADCIVSKDWLVNALQCFETTHAALVGSFHKNPKDGGWFAQTSEIISQTKIGSNVNYIPSGNMLIRRECFFEVEGFNESLETNEDVDLCQRIKRKGDGIFADPSIEAIHLGAPRTVKDFFLREIWHGKSSFRAFLNDLKRLVNSREIWHEKSSFRAFLNSLKRIMNWKVILYSVAFALVLMNFVVGLAWYILADNNFPFFLNTLFLIFLVAVISYRIGIRQPAFFSVLLYSILYGIARGLSLLFFLRDGVMAIFVKKGGELRAR